LKPTRALNVLEADEREAVRRGLGRVDLLDVLRAGHSLAEIELSV
jgi:hypothetical protein